MTEVSDVPQRFTNCIGMTFVRIPAGEFSMGSQASAPRWFWPSLYMRSACRAAAEPTRRSDEIGFRCAAPKPGVTSAPETSRGVTAAPISERRRRARRRGPQRPPQHPSIERLAWSTVLPRTARPGARKRRARARMRRWRPQ